MESLNKVFSKTITKTHDIYRFFGIRFSVKTLRFFKALTKESIIVQDNYDLSELKQAKKIIVFFVSPIIEINGGIISIFNLCKYTRELIKDSYVMLVTYPGKYTYAKNDNFYNNEKVFRFDQLIKNAKCVEEMILHIPEYYADKFISSLSANEKNFFKSIKNLHINILNQNILFMPEAEKINKYKQLSSNITATCAHEKYCNQDYSNKYDIPFHLLSAHMDILPEKIYSFNEKEKIIVLSPDTSPFKDELVEHLKKSLPDFRFISVQNMKFKEYIDLISKAYFTISFGEGFDSYLLQPELVNSLGFSVYNEAFFPDKSWLDLKNIYLNPDDMLKNIISDFKYLSQNEDAYNKLIDEVNQKAKIIYSIEKYKGNLNKFYQGKYDFYPIK